VGSHNEEVLQGLLGLDDETLEELRRQAVIS
jgi:crotonobetainyl-CoA:carnitine CoA-transferase CaiB-like acyl-CoA transferase